MKTMSTIVGLVVLILATDAFGADCVIRRLPDGSYTSECPSESPPIPPSSVPAMVPMPSLPMPAPPPAIYPAQCTTSSGQCAMSFGGPPPYGASCICRDQFDNRFDGVIQP